jgi:serine/threonine-protein kinase
MIGCPPRADLQDLLANRLGAEREPLLLAHVETCAACQEILEELTAVCAPGSRTAVAGDGDSPRREPGPEADTFWRGLKALNPNLSSTSPPGSTGDPPTGGTTKDAPAALPQRLGRYQLLEEIGRGGMGAVLRGHDPDLGRDLAVKVLLPERQYDPAMRSRFVEEAQIGGQLQHPGVVPVYEMGRSADQRPYFTMKLVKGRTLAALLRERSNPGQDLPRFEQIFEQVCQTVAYAHSRGVIHRDLKPGNVMVGAFGEVQVMDWGLAKVLSSLGRPAPSARPGQAGQDSSLAPLALPGKGIGGEGRHTQPGHVLGTPAYMAPEQAAGEVDRLDQRCDVFGLGAILCEILTGQPPYVGEDEEQMLFKARCADLVEAFARLDTCGADPQLVRLARSSLAVEAAARPRDAGVLAAEMAAYRESIQTRLRQAELAQAEARARAAEERKRRRLAVRLGGAVVALLAALAVGGLYLQHQRARIEGERALAAEKRSQRQERARDAVQAVLAQVGGLLERAAWAEAKALLDQAERRLEEAADADLQARVRRAGSDLELARDLDKVRLDAATLVEGKWTPGKGTREYEAAFRAHGLDVLGGESQEVLARIRGTGVSKQVATALDHWAALERGKARRLLTLARGADPDPVRDRLRDPALWASHPRLRRLAVREQAGRLPPALLVVLGELVGEAGGDGVGWLAEGQRRHPRDFWLSFTLANALRRKGRLEEALGYYRVALAVRRPDSAVVYNNLGVALAESKDLAGAIASFRRALALDPKLAQALTSLGNALAASNDLPGAIASYRRLVALNPKDAVAHNSLGIALAVSNDLAGAIVSFNRAVALDRTYGKAYGALGQALLRQGRFAEARDATRRCLGLLGAGHPLRQVAIQQLQQCERLLALEPRLTAVLQGKAEPKDAAESLALAGLAQLPYQRRYAEAASLYARAFAAQPQLADDLRAGHRYNAACAAALAAAGRGKGGGKLDDKEKARLRGQALGWLKADLLRWAHEARGTAAQRQQARQQLEHGKADPDLAGVRDRAVRDRLPEGERAAWRKFWSEVENLLKSLAAKK